MQVRPAGQAGYPISLVASLDTVPVKCCVPCINISIRKGEDKGRKREKFYIYLDVTHTHTRPEPVNPERQKEEKSEHRRRAEGQNSAGGGGEQTDLKNQPTRRNGPDQNSAHT